MYSKGVELAATEPLVSDPAHPTRPPSSRRSRSRPDDHAHEEAGHAEGSRVPSLLNLPPAASSIPGVPWQAGLCMCCSAIGPTGRTVGRLPRRVRERHPPPSFWSALSGPDRAPGGISRRVLILIAALVMRHSNHRLGRVRRHGVAAVVGLIFVGIVAVFARLSGSRPPTRASRQVSGIDSNMRNEEPRG